MVQCSVPHCRSKGVFRFPKNEKRRKQWERAIHVDFRSSASSRLCAIHFEKDNFIEEQTSYRTGLPLFKRFLKKNAVPSQMLSLKEDYESRARKLRRRLFGVDYSTSSTSCPRILSVPEEATEECFTCGEAVSEVSMAGQGAVVFNDSNFQQEDTEIPDTNSHVQVQAMIHPKEPLLNQLRQSKNHSSTQCVSEDIIKVQDNKENIKRKEASIQVNLSSDCPNMRSVGIQTNLGYYTVSMLVDDNKGMLFYTGLESYAKFELVFQTLSPYVDKLRFKRSEVIRVTPQDMLFLTLIKLRRNKPDCELSRLFAISVTLVSNIFHTWINFMYQLWSLMDTWPSRELVDFYMPKSFKKLYPSTRIIVDATEIPIVKPTHPVAQQATFSTYKNRNTVKVLVGASPDGLLSYCSAAYGGSTSDRQIVERSDLIKKCQKGDCIMADRGFNVQDICAPQGVAVNIPHFLKGKQQLPGMTVLSDRKLSSKRVHIERLIGLTKTFRILRTPLNPYYTQLATKIYSIYVMLCNFRDCIVSKEA